MHHRKKRSPDDVGNHNNVDAVYENETSSYEHDITMYDTTLYENEITSSSSVKHVYTKQMFKQGHNTTETHHYDFTIYSNEK